MKKIAQIIFVVNYGVVRAGVGLEVAIGIVVVGKAAAGAAGEGLGLADEATGGIVAAADGGVGVGGGVELAIGKVAEGAGGFAVAVGDFGELNPSSTEAFSCKFFSTSLGLTRE